MKVLLALVSFFILHSAVAQQFVLSNEKLLYSFNLPNKKKAVLAADSNDQYIVYRFGSKNQIELEYPTLKDQESWKKFEYSYYLRGGGAENTGLDLNYFAFVHEEFKYVLYDSYSASDNKTYVGIRVFNAQEEEIEHINGNPKSCKGLLIDFRNSTLIKTSDRTYD